ncbi:MAG: septal ring lytic transglycosylase RlpA family protein [Leptospiraceae bacterium]|nr:septal ring lytic transglycosylase RlpA family protein [Leptospiraceae bacterium]MCP5500757.1 septal ring lytic transglycosylase RlpA family protein [Leptospiraceae bacterium]
MKVIKYLIFLLLPISLFSNELKIKEGYASYYNDKLHGRPTSSGEPYNKNDRTGAHLTLPFGTFLKVTNISNGMSTIVRINDRGPFHKSRIVDVSKKAAEELDMIRAGKIKVRIEVVSKEEATSTSPKSETVKPQAEKDKKPSTGKKKSSGDEFSEFSDTEVDPFKEFEESLGLETGKKEKAVKVEKKSTSDKTSNSSQSSTVNSKSIFDEKGVDIGNPGSVADSVEEVENTKKEEKKVVKESEPVKNEKKTTVVEEKSTEKKEPPVENKSDETKKDNKISSEDMRKNTSITAFLIQVLVYTDREKAEKYADELRSWGYKPVYIQKVIIENTDYYRIHILQYPTIREARVDLKKLRTKGLKPVVKRYQFICK